jgi:cyclopropane-fatty-acyl-phospholipid synthase
MPKRRIATDRRAPVGDPQAGWEEAIAEVGPGRVWRLDMAASGVNFEAGRRQVHQVLEVRLDEGRYGVPLRPGFG